MSLIEFKNLPDTSTPLTAENLNNNFEYLDNKIVNVNSESTTNAYSCDYVNDKLYYKTGDFYQPGYYVCAGFLSGGAKELQITIPTPKSMKNINSLEITYLDIVVRGNNGYLFSRTQDKTNWSITKEGEYNIALKYLSPTELGTNNTPISATLYAAFKIKFI